MDSTSIKGALLPIILTDLNKSWEKMLHLGTPISFPARSVISWREDPLNIGMYLVRKGLVKLSSMSQAGNERAHFYIGRDTFFHEIPTLCETNDYIFICLEPTNVVFFPKKLITSDFTRQYPEAILNMLESLSTKCALLYANMCREHSRSVFAKVCHALYRLHLFNRTGDVIVPRLTRQELAAYLGIHRSSLHKALNRLHDEGVTGAYSKRELPVYDTEALLNYALE